MKLSAIVMAIVAFGMSALGLTAAVAQTAPTTAAPIQVLNLQYQPVLTGDEIDEGGGQMNPGLMVTFKEPHDAPDSRGGVCDK